MKTIYIIGSLRNPAIPEIGGELRKLGFDAFDDWHAAGPTADDEWKRYELSRGRTYKEALKGHAADHVFSFDLHHLTRSNLGLLVCPAGKSGHLELGYLAGQGKPTFVLLEEGVDRWDVMYQFCTDVFMSYQELCDEIVKYRD